jgi:polyphosphate kinase
MPRNLDQRIEVVVPVHDPKVQQELEAVLDVGWNDKAFVWQLHPDGSWKAIGERGKKKMGVGSQELLMRRARARTARTKKGKKS